MPRTRRPSRPARGYGTLVVACALAALALSVGSGNSATASYRDEVLADVPTGYWRLGETNGTSAQDETVNATTGAYQGGVTLGVSGAIAGDPNTAARFDGVNDLVTMGDPASGVLDFGTGDFTVEAWVKTSVNGERLVAGKQSSGPYWQLTVTDDSGDVGSVRAKLFDGSVTLQGYSLARVDDGAWHHVTVVYDRDTGISFYVDGAASGSTLGATPGNVTNAAPLQVGKVSGYSYFSGDIDEVAVYGAALSLGRIQAHHQAALVDTTPPAVTLTTPANGSSTTDTTPTFSGAAGTAVSDSTTLTVKVYSGSSVGGTLVQTLTTTLAGASYAVDASSPLALGTYTAQAEQSDSAGNIGFSSASTFEVTLADQNPPVVTLTTPANGSSTSDTTPTFAGGAGMEPGDTSTVTVKVYSGSSVGGTPIQTLTTTVVGGSYSVDASTPLALGTYTGQAEQSDAAGNTGFSAASTFSVTDPVLVGAGDIASCGTTAQDEETAQLLDGLPGATVFTLGDNAYEGGSAEEFTNCYDPTWGRHKARTRPSLGNHDYSNGGAAGYFGYFGTAAGDQDKGYYSYDVGAWHVVVLNTNCYPVGGCNPGSPQEQWLRADLAAHPSDCTLAYWHHPRFSSSATGSADVASQTFWEVLYEHGADLILTGHAHLYERFAPQTPAGTLDLTYGIRQITAGTGGYALYPFGTIAANSEVRFNDAHGVLKLTLYPTGYDWVFLPVAGQTSTDSGSGTCHSAPPPPPPPPADTSPPTDPSDLQVSATTTTSISLIWTASSDNVGVAGYDVFANGAKMGTVAIPGYTVSGLACGTSYTLGVEAFDAAGNRSQRTTVSASTSACPPPPEGAPFVRGASVATANGPATQLAIARPPVTTDGDLLIAIVAHQGGSANTMSPPAGWMAVPGTDHYQAKNARIHAWYKFAGPVEPATYVFTLTGSGDDMSGGVLAVANASPTAPINASGGQTNASPSKSVTAPSISTTVTDTLLLFGGACNNSSTFLPDQLMTELWDIASGGTYRVATEAASQYVAAAGATGTRTATASSKCKSVAVQIAIAPAP